MKTRIKIFVVINEVGIYLGGEKGPGFGQFYIQLFLDVNSMKVPNQQSLQLTFENTGFPRYPRDYIPDKSQTVTTK